MKYIFKFAIRNLIRQKRRNILLGTAIAFGMMILVIANSFSHGISDTLINRIIVIMTGHIDVAMVEDGNARAPFMREKERFEKIIHERVNNIKTINENMGLLARMVGNGRSDNSWIVGIAEKDIAPFADQMKALEGDVRDMFNRKMTNPCVLSKNKADYLKVKLHDTLRIRLQNIYGQQQTGVFTVAAIVKSANMFTDFASFISIQNVKRLRSLREYETGSLQIILDNPETSIQQASHLHSFLKPGLAYIPSLFIYQSKKISGFTFGFFRDKISKDLFKDQLNIDANNLKKCLSEKGVILSIKMAKAAGIQIGEPLTLQYENRYDSLLTEKQYKVTGFFQNREGLFPENTMLLSDKLFYQTYYNHLPLIMQNDEKTVQNKISPKLLPSISTEWKLLPRSKDFNEMKKKFKDFMSQKIYAAVLDVRTMHETGSNIIKLEKVLNLITLSAVLVLFFIILIGVVNTLRMTIKERIREFGTIRAIGMQRNDLCRLIITETFFLALLGTISGTVFAFMIMRISQIWEIHASSFMNILLVNHRLYFVPDILSIFLNMLLILTIAVLTAYFPARKASRMIIAEALRHHE